jgi:hypothetical protein
MRDVLKRKWAGQRSNCMENRKSYVKGCKKPYSRNMMSVI